jgi:HK97 family phage portal protein
MSLFTTITSWLFDGLQRQQGIQYTAPATYAESAASTVTFDSALQLSGVWSCVKLISETVASLPLTIYENTESGRKKADLIPLATLFNGKVNRYQNKVEFFETVLLNLIIHGNSYCIIQKSAGRIIGLLPIMASQVQTVLLPDGTVVHEYYYDGGVKVYAQESIWHLKMMGNGIVGLSPLAYQRNTLGIAQAAESAVTKIYRNGAKPSGVLSIDRVLTTAQRDAIRANFSTLVTTNDERLLVLEGGMKFDAISLSPADIELLASRQFQLSEICRWYGVPSVMVNDTSSTTVWGSGIEQIVAGFYKVTLRPILEKIEQSMVVTLLGDTTGKYEVEFNFEGLLRADQKSRFDGYRVGIQGGILTPNEARNMEGLPVMDGGDELFMQSATLPISKLGQSTTNNANTQGLGNDNIT